MVKVMLNDAMYKLHDQSLVTIELLQASFPDNKDFMINISTLFDPRYMFLIYAPILFAINKRVGHRAIIALTLTEWSNQILKWLLAGERPYWYVHERAHELANSTAASARLAQDAYLGRPLAELKQFPVTCELGAGSPSGHAMVTATVWYILVDAYLKGELPVFSKADYSSIQPAGHALGNKLAKLTWSFYTIILVLVSLSRVYLACHFPHQCVCGAILGFVVARLVVERLPMERLSPLLFALVTAAMFASALSTYGLLRRMGMNPLWSVDKGMRWCVKKEYIHLDTTPFFSMIRYLGFCLGSGLAYDSSKIASTLSRSMESAGAPLVTRRALCALASVLFGQALLSVPLPRSNMMLFYLNSFVLYAIFSYAIASPIPRLVKRLLESPPAAEAAKVKAH